MSSTGREMPESRAVKVAVPLMEPQSEPAEEAEPPVDAGEGAEKNRGASKRERRPRRQTGRGRRNSVSGESTSQTLEPEVVAEHPKSEEEIAAIRDVISQCFLFAHLDESTLNRTALAMFKVEKQAGDVIIRQSTDDEDNFYVVAKGVCKCYQGALDESGLVAVCEPGDGFGELKLMYSTPRQASVLADTDVSLWALDRGSFKALLIQAQQERRKRHLDFLDNVAAFTGLVRSETLLIADVMEDVDYKDGEVIFNQGDASTDFYLVQEGEVVVSQLSETSGTAGDTPEPEPEPAEPEPEPAGATTLLTLHRGDYFGELGLLLNRPRLATCTAQGDTKVGKVHKEIFQRILPRVNGFLRKNAKQQYTTGAPLPADL